MRTDDTVTGDGPYKHLIYGRGSAVETPVCNRGDFPQQMKYDLKVSFCITPLKKKLFYSSKVTAGLTVGPITPHRLRTPSVLSGPEVTLGSRRT